MINFILMKWKQAIIFSVLAVILFFFFKIIYSVLQISAIYPPMKEYIFSLKPGELANKIIRITNDDSNMNYKLTDSTGTLNDDLNYYADIYLKDDSTLFMFNFFYNKSGKEQSKINLVGAFDKTHQFGGYENNSKDMQSLINIFEKNFIDRINFSP